MNKRFSIIIPAYNAEGVIKRVVESVNKQTFKDFEIIVVDDCSKDNTYELTQTLENVIVRKTPQNAKEGGARNLGMSIANGEYIIFIDADDFLASDDVLEKINNVIENDTPDLVYLGFQTLGNGEGKEELWIPTEENSTFKERARHWTYEVVWDVCWNAKFLKENNIIFAENKLHPDFPFYYEGILKAKSYKVASFVSHIYTVQSNTSITSSKVHPGKLKDLYFNVDRCLDMIEQVDEDKKEDFIYGIYRVVEYSCRVLRQYEKETRELNEKK